jgi:hypothetical protein
MIATGERSFCCGGVGLDWFSAAILVRFKQKVLFHIVWMIVLFTLHFKKEISMPP